MKLTKFQAEAVWAVLIVVCGANQSDEAQADFVHHAQKEQRPPLEYRFQGSLGFGGKIYLENPPRVSCYKEDETSDENRKIKNANRLLAAIAMLW